MSTSFFNTVEGNGTDNCNHSVLIVANEGSAFRPDFPHTLGTVVRQNTLLASRSEGITISGGSAGTAQTPVGPALLGTLVEQNFVGDARTAYASSAGSDGVVMRRNHAYFWGAGAAGAVQTAFRIGRPNASAWVKENTVEGPSPGGHDGIRLLDQPERR